MKRIFFFICCLSISLQMFAQNNFSKELFPVLAGLQRTECTGHYREIDDDEGYRIYKDFTSSLSAPQKEFTINGQKYLKWGVFSLREEDGKILVYSEILNKDLVLYDFTLEVGDTLTTLLLDFCSETNSVVDYPLYLDPNEPETPTFNIDTLIVTKVSKITLLDGKEYKEWRFNNGWSYVEKVGYLYGDFFSIIKVGYVIGNYIGTYLICISQDGKQLYKASDDYIERYDLECECLNNDIPTNIETITAPSPAIQKVIHEGQLYIIRDGKVYNVMGVEERNVSFDF